MQDVRTELPIEPSRILDLGDLEGRELWLRIRRTSGVLQSRADGLRL